MFDPSLAGREDLAALLRFYLDLGVDCAVAEAPVDRFLQSQERLAAPQVEAQPEPAFEPRQTPLPAPPPERSPEPRRAPPPRPVAPIHAAAVVPDAAAALAREKAGGAATLEELRALLEVFDGCALKNSATQLVFADGAPDARVMVIGEGPGADEDRIGRPFVGRAGQLLDKMLAAIGLDRTKVYIANVVPWRPPGNRTPTPQELAICLPFVRRQIELVAPDFLILLGASAAQTILSEKEGIMRLRGHWRHYACGDKSIRALPMLHPAYLLRAPLAKAQAWRDLRALQKAMDQA